MVHAELGEGIVTLLKAVTRFGLLLGASEILKPLFDFLLLVVQVAAVFGKPVVNDLASIIDGIDFLLRLLQGHEVVAALRLLLLPVEALPCLNEIEFFVFKHFLIHV